MNCRPGDLERAEALLLLVAAARELDTSAALLAAVYSLRGNTDMATTGQQSLSGRPAAEGSTRRFPNLSCALAAWGRHTWSEQGVAGAQRPVPRRPELRDLRVDVDVDSAEEVDVLAVRRLQVREDLVVDEPPLPPHRLHRQAEVLRGPRHDGVGRQGQAPRLLALGL
jgi:hypothetical protein